MTDEAGGAPLAPADLLLRNARFYGTAARHDLRIRGGAIEAVADPGTLPGTGTEILDLDGRYVGPGLWDEHVHFTQWVTQRDNLDLSGAASAADVLALVRARCADPALAPGVRLTGFGFRDALWPDVPSLRGLDEIAPDRPVILIAGDLHCAWLNSVAASMLGVATDATGMLREGPWLALFEEVAGDQQPGLEDFAAAADAAAARGVVGIVDLEFADNVSHWRERVRAGVRSLRVETGVWPARLEETIAAGLRTGDLLEPSGLIRMGRLKVIVDGSLNTRTAWCWDPYPGAAPGAIDPCGVASVPLAELKVLLARARDHGLDACVHAIGDRANSGVIDTFAELGIAGRIEHAQLLDVRDVARIADLGLIASVQPEHAMDDRDVADTYWHGRTDRAFAFGSLHRAGATLRFGSDAPVAPLDPWYAVAAATSRSRDDRSPWHEEECVPIDVAMAASARGRLRPQVGDPADLVVLDLDPATAERDQLRTMPVAGTLLGGRWTWRNL